MTSEDCTEITIDRCREIINSTVFYLYCLCDLFKHFVEEATGQGDFVLQWIRFASFQFLNDNITDRRNQLVIKGSAS